MSGRSPARKDLAARLRRAGSQELLELIPAHGRELTLRDVRQILRNPFTTARVIEVVATEANGAHSNTATATVSVVAVNDAPTAVDDAFTTDEDTLLNAPAGGVALGNVFDANPTTPASAALRCRVVRGLSIVAGSTPEL